MDAPLNSRQRRPLEINIQSVGNLGNRTIQYMAALKLQSLIEGSIVTGADVWEWGITRAPAIATHVHSFTFDVGTDVNFDAIVELVRRGLIDQIDVLGYMQRIKYFLQPSFYRDVFKPSVTDHAIVCDTEICINVRGGDILRGVPHYPILPIAYYEYVVERSGLKPVFMGQLDDNAYTAALQRFFPQARFIPSQGVMKDFATVRTARHIAISVSTFSWLAAWLSQAETIYLPLAGFLCSNFLREVDLLPTSDERYRFIFMPLFFGDTIDRSMVQHERIAEHIREIPRQQVRRIIEQGPEIRRWAPNIVFDERYYLHTNVQAAVEVAEGTHDSALTHFLEVGIHRGYEPVRLLPPTLRAEAPPGLTSLNALATANQSSTSQWSNSPTTEDDAFRALTGPHLPFAFHTAEQDNPWWRADFKMEVEVDYLEICNRVGPLDSLVRATPMVVEHCLDGEWEPVLTIEAQTFFDADRHRVAWRPARPIKLRSLRIRVPRITFLHLSNVAIFGRSSGL